VRDQGAARPLRILHVIHDYYPAIGGSELVFQKIGEGLASRGLEVLTFTSTARRVGDFVEPDAAQLPAGAELVGGVHVTRLPYVQLPRPLRSWIGAASHVWSSHRWPGYGKLKALWVGPHLPGLVRRIVGAKPDVIAATAAPFLPIYNALRAGQQVRRPVAIMPCLHPGDRWLIDNPSQLKLLERADAVMTLTQYEAQFLRAQGVAGDRISIVGGGVSPDEARIAERDLRERFRIPEHERLVLFCGRKEEHKGVQDVVEAMVRLWQQDVRATVVLAGASTIYSKTRLAQFLSRLPLEWARRVIVRDDIAEAEKWGWYTACDVLAHPSQVESFGLVYLEAWLCGKPVIGGRTGPQAALVEDERDGLLVRPHSVEELAMSLRRVLVDTAFAERLGRRGRQKVLEDFTWDKVVDRAAALYMRLAGLTSLGRHELDPTKRDLDARVAAKA
jgi:phosphatidylinositol alpha-1,6-mannosyltransferase